jgi:hypothetical protein
VFAGFRRVGHWEDSLRPITHSGALLKRLTFKGNGTSRFTMFDRPARRESPKVRATLYLSEEILDQARNAAVHLAGYPARLTLTKLAENALRAELERLKELYNNGQDFPRRDADLRGGRPIAA